MRSADFEPVMSVSFGFPFAGHAARQIWVRRRAGDVDESAATGTGFQAASDEIGDQDPWLDRRRACRSAALSLLVFFPVPASLVPQISLCFGGLTRVLLAANLQPVVRFVDVSNASLACVLASVELVAQRCFARRHRSSLACRVRDVVSGDQPFARLAECPILRAKLRRERGGWRDRKRVDILGQDKRSSPVERQAIDMACVQPCRSVGGSAAVAAFLNDNNEVFGTARICLRKRLAQ